jgi:hypothetical protein
MCTVDEMLRHLAIGWIAPQIPESSKPTCKLSRRQLQQKTEVEVETSCHAGAQQ